jgi:hypothetical protein
MFCTSLVLTPWVPKYGNYRPHMKFQISLPLVLHHDESKSALTARYAILLLYLGHHNGSRFKRLSVAAVAEILADFESELSDFTANCVKSLCSHENTLRTFIQRRIMHKTRKTRRNSTENFMYVMN